MSTSLVGLQFDHRYELTELVASGGMATVYRAVDHRLDRDVAVKVLHQHLASEPKTVSRFQEEARTAAKLNHPHVVNVMDQGLDEQTGRPYLVMEYIHGNTLRQVLNHHGKFAPHVALAYLAAISNGLAAAHRAGLVHRDMKPENVLVSEDGRIKVTDFGLMRPADQHTQTHTLMGTVAYVSPELVKNLPADARSDIYAVGIMLFEMLTGRQPFRAQSPMQVAYKHAHERVPDPRTLTPDIPEEIAQLVLACTEPDPDQRPAHAGVLAARVKTLRSGSSEVAEEESPRHEFRAVQPETATQVLEELPSPSATSRLEDHSVATEAFGQHRPEPHHLPVGPPAASNTPTLGAPARPAQMTMAQRRQAKRPRVQLRRPQPAKSIVLWILFLAGAGVLGYLGFMVALSLWGF